MIIKKLSAEWKLRKYIKQYASSFAKLGYHTDDIGRLYKILNYEKTATTNISDIQRHLVEEQQKLYDFLIQTQIMDPNNCIPVIERLEDSSDDNNESFVIAIYPCYGGEAYITPENLTRYARYVAAAVIIIPTVSWLGYFAYSVFF